MAIYVNGKTLTPKINGNSLEKRYYKEREQLIEMFKKFKLKGVEKPVIILEREYNKQWNKTKTSFKPAPPMALPLIAHIYDEELGSLEVRYSSTPPRQVKPNVLSWDSNKNESMMFETVALTEDKLDYAWFMLKASKYLEKGLFRIIDTRAKYSNTYNEAVLQKDAMNLLFGPDMTEEYLARIAVEFMDDNEVDYEKITGVEELATKIWDKAMANTKSNKKPGLKELIETGKKVIPEKTVEQEFEYEGEKIPLLECPNSVEWPAMVEEAKKYNITTQGKKKNILYSILEYLKSKE